MNKNFKNTIIRNLDRSLSGIQGKKQFHSLFRTLYYLSLKGLNYGQVHSMEHDGELFQMKRIKTLLQDKEDFIIFDVGANEGQYAKLLLKVFDDKKANLHLFEPSMETFQRLSKNLEGAGVSLNNFGLSDKEENVVLYTSDQGSDYASVYKSEKSNHSEEIELRTLDGYCDACNIDHIDFLKIDVEGHEFKCLLGAERMLNDGKIHFIQFEFGVSNIYSRVFFRDIYNFLSDKGYSIGRILRNGIAPLHKYHPNLEVYLTTNYLAQLKKTR